MQEALNAIERTWFRERRTQPRRARVIDQTRLNPTREQPFFGAVNLRALSERFRMDDFANASFQPDVVALMDTALANAVSKLPHPVSSAHVHAIAQTILRSASEGERNVVALETLALLELQLAS
jgi:hypothetical protein